MASEKEGGRTFRVIFVTVLAILVVFMVCSYFLTMPLGLVLFYSTPNGTAISAQSYYLPIEFFMFLGFYFPLNAGVAFMLLWILFIVCFIAAWKLRKSFVQAIKNGVSQSVAKLFDNNLFMMPIISSTLLVAFIMINFFQEDVAGIPTGEIPIDPNLFLTFFRVAYAPFVEELSFRVSSIGFLLILYLFVVGREQLAKLSTGQILKLIIIIPLYPDKAKRWLGVKTVRDHGIRAISAFEWIMIIITSVVFGIFHYLYGGGWGPGKITTATLDGLVFGLTYLMYGAQAPILLHWFFNYYLWFITQPEFALQYYPNIYPVFLIAWLGILILGCLGFATFITIGISKIMKKTPSKETIYYNT
ncbi:MAG: CPBP family glutamic-type intramembrane protease [Candidatus Bathyarchaeota archaeon]|nr:CPBP family glutamic-type intramembrane protease [Candidatus Bathyarchaeota archaeon]MDH5733841.1 CPBP family glutamic-type intramembrane protease [Candidatus Bathyarchaeota archaeon]